MEPLGNASLREIFRAVPPILQPQQAIVHFIQVSFHSGPILGKGLLVCVEGFVLVHAASVKTDVKNIHYAQLVLAVFSERLKRQAAAKYVAI